MVPLENFSSVRTSFSLVHWKPSYAGNAVYINPWAPELNSWIYGGEEGTSEKEICLRTWAETATHIIRAMCISAEGCRRTCHNWHGLDDDFSHPLGFWASHWVMTVERAIIDTVWVMTSVALWASEHRTGWWLTFFGTTDSSVQRCVMLMQIFICELFHFSSYSRVTFVKSLSFCILTFSVGFTNCPDKYWLHVTKWATVVLTVLTVQVTAAPHIHSSVTWPYSPPTSVTRHQPILIWPNARGSKKVMLLYASCAQMLWERTPKAVGEKLHAAYMCL
jgi:hypothetical protein